MSATLAAAPLMHGDVPLGEAVSFWILGPIALAGGLGMVLFRNAVHSALSLAATMMCLGAMYMVEQGPFIGFVQIIVYTGAIMILFLFVLMLVGRDSSDSIVESLRGQRWAAALFGLGVRAAGRRSAVGRAFKDIKPVNLDGQNAGGTNVQLARRARSSPSTCSRSSSTSALLIVAAVGAMVLAHVERDGPSPRRSRPPASASGRAARSRCPAPACCPPATRSERRRCCPTARSSEESVHRPRRPAIRELAGRSGR